MKKVTLVNNNSDIPSPGLVVAGAAIAGTLLFIPALLFSVFRASVTIARTGHRLVIGRHTGHPVQHPSHDPHLP